MGGGLLEGVPGIAKTTLVRSLAAALGAEFHRVSFTPDLLPADVTGTQVYNPKDGSFTPKKGPVFTNLLLADEINRAPAKVQSALLEAMQERQVTIGDVTYPLPQPFLVLATQNPIEQEGTYPLPEAQVDRFLFKVIVPMPSRDDERRIMERFSHKEAPKVSPVLRLEELESIRDALDQVYCDEKVGDYILDLVFSTREPEKHNLNSLKGLIDLGASPRASINLNMAARANAQDVKEVAPDILRHRIQLSYEAESRGLTAGQIVRTILDETPVP